MYKILQCGTERVQARHGSAYLCHAWSAPTDLSGDIVFGSSRARSIIYEGRHIPDLLFNILRQLPELAG
jgi:hypothetical protein